MSTNKFLSFLNGTKTLFTAIKISTGIPDANKILSTDDDGKIHASFLPAGIGAANEVMIASESLLAGDFVNIWLDGGERKVRKADASNGRVANGFVTSTVNVNTNATIILQGVNSSLTGLVVGSKYFLSATSPGLPTLTAPTNLNTIVQELGYAVSSSRLNFEFDSPFTNA